MNILSDLIHTGLQKNKKGLLHRTCNSPLFFYIPNFAMIRANLALVSSFSFFRAST